MKHQQRVNAFVRLGEELLSAAENPQHGAWASTIRQAEAANGWFTQENICLALKGIAHMLQPEKLEEWLSAYPDIPEKGDRTVGIIMAGNIPLVGFHDLLCVLISGNRAVIKVSSQDRILPEKLLETLASIDPELADSAQLLDGKLEGFTHIIATGSDNSSRYFEYYFGKYPNIIRKNRNAVAIITGNESHDELRQLGKDIFRYFGLGCRNVSKVYLGQNASPEALLDALEDWAPIAQHTKYFHNYEYHKAIFLVEKMPHLDNGFLLMREDAAFGCPVGVLHYQPFLSLEQIRAELDIHKDRIQCVVASPETGIEGAIPFGSAQTPEPWDYADGVDTMRFLLNENGSTR